MQATVHKLQILKDKQNHLKIQGKIFSFLNSNKKLILHKSTQWQPDLIKLICLLLSFLN